MNAIKLLSLLQWLGDIGGTTNIEPELRCKVEWMNETYLMTGVEIEGLLAYIEELGKKFEEDQKLPEDERSMSIGSMRDDVKDWLGEGNVQWSTLFT